MTTIESTERDRLTAAPTCGDDCPCERPPEPTPGRRRYLARGLVLSGLTVAWNVIEGCVAIGAGLVAGSTALLGFGVDSFVEVLAGLVMVWRLQAERSGRLPNEAAEQRAMKLIAATFFLLATYVTVESVRDVVGSDRADTSGIGLGLTALSLVVMPILARQKRRLGREMGSASMTADSKETDLCVYLSATVFLGLAVNALFGWWWADSVAALAIAGIAVREGYEAWTKEDLNEC